MGFEPMVRVLQTLAFPLGYAADSPVDASRTDHGLNNDLFSRHYTRHPADCQYPVPASDGRADLNAPSAVDRSPRAGRRQQS